MGQAPPQADRIPAQQQRATVQRLGAGGIVIEHDDLQGRSGGLRRLRLFHGTIVP